MLQLRVRRAAPLARVCLLSQCLGFGLAALPSAADLQPGPSEGSELEAWNFRLRNAVLEAQIAGRDGLLQAIRVRNKMSGREMPPADVLLARLPGPGPEVSDFRVLGMNLSRIEAQANASQLALSMPGWAVTAVMESLSAPWMAVWSVELRDGSNYLKLSARLTYRGRSADEQSAEGDPEAEAELCLLSGNLPGSSVAGKVDGVPITSDDFFFGLEHPQGLNSAKAGEYRCCLKQHTAKIKEHGPHAALVLGVTVPGQVRRSFLHYLERERAHPSRKMLHYNSWYDIGTGQQFDAKQAINRLDHIARELSRRGVMLDSFLLDDGWDNPDSGPWNAHEGFRDLKQLEDRATHWKTSLGLWFSPFGGYHEARRDVQAQTFVVMQRAIQIIDRKLELSPSPRP